MSMYVDMESFANENEQNAAQYSFGVRTHIHTLAHHTLITVLLLHKAGSVHMSMSSSCVFHTEKK